MQTLKQPVTLEKNLDQVKKKIDQVKSPGKQQVKESQGEKLARCNFELPVEKLQQLKIKCIELNKSIREIMESYIDTLIKK